MAIVRPATAEDLAAIEAVERASFGDPWSRKSFADSLQHEFVRLHVVETDGEVVGFSIVWVSGEECDLANLAVHPTRRGEGLGKALLDEALRQAKSESLAVMFLEVRASNAAALRLYESRGFHEVGRRPAYYRNPVEDALVLRCDL